MVEVTEMVFRKVYIVLCAALLAAGAQQQRIQAKYMAILDRTLLNFYAGQDIKL